LFCFNLVDEIELLLLNLQVEQNTKGAGSNLTRRVLILLYIYIYQEKLTLHLYSVNGKHLSKDVVSAPITDMLVAEGHLIIGNEDGDVAIKQLYGFDFLTNFI